MARIWNQPDGPMHLAHFSDGYPLCWPMDVEGVFVATEVEADVVCPDCLRYMAEE